LVSLKNAADAAGIAAQLARQRYSSGLVDFQTVLETQRTQLSTQDGVANATTDVSLDQVRLFKALGGGWQDDIAALVAQPKSVTSTEPWINRL
jgi:outer membrane protein TolC